MPDEPLHHSAPEAMARRILRWAFKGRLITRSLPRDLGGAKVRVAPESQLKYLKPGASGLDMLLLRLAREFVKPGDLVWDIGANVGIFTFAAAGKGAHVLAVEPDPAMSNALLDSRGRNPGLAVEILAAAISDEAGVAALSIASGGRASNTLAKFAGYRSAFGLVLEEVLVPTVTLDSLLERGAPAFVKIDIEGAELAALQSAGRLLAQARPVIQIEVGVDVREEASALLKAAGYLLFDTVQWMQPIEICTMNTICIPTERRP